jgi:hypothetical protein
MFIGVSAHACTKIYVYTVFRKKKNRLTLTICVSILFVPEYTGGC